MSGVGNMLVGDAEAVLRREVDKLRGGSAFDRLVLGWLLPDLYGAEVQSVAQVTVSQWREMKQGGSPRSYQAVASLALACAMNANDSERMNTFNDGFDWVLGASIEMDGTPIGLAADPPAILAIVTAVLRAADLGRQNAMRTWIASVHDKFDKHLGWWERAQIRIAALLLGEQHISPPELSEACCVTRVAVTSIAETLTSNDEREITAAVLNLHTQVDQIGSAFLLAALFRVKARIVRSIRAEVMTIDDVIALLRNITRSLRDWTWEDRPRTKMSQIRQWHVDHEYHVQNLLWVVLAPLFSDLESEGYSTKIGFTQPRADLVIPSLRLIIEAKFARQTDSLREVQRQLAQDAAMYFPMGGQYDRMIAFVWDDAARTEEHATLIQGLEKLERVAGVIVVSRPSKMHSPKMVPASTSDTDGTS